MDLWRLWKNGTKRYVYWEIIAMMDSPEQLRAEGKVPLFFPDNGSLLVLWLEKVYRVEK